MKTVDKEVLFRQAAVLCGERLGIGKNEQLELISIISSVFVNVDCVTEDNMLSVDVAPNDVIIKNYIGCKRLAGRKESTLEAYQYTINMFLSNKPINLLNATTNDIRQFLIYLKAQRNASNTTINNARRNLSSLFQFMSDEGYIQSNPVKRIEQVKTEKKVRLPYSEEEYEQLLRHCNCKRDIALLQLLYSSGLRISEVSRLNINDVNLVNKAIRVINGKGGKDRITYMSKVSAMYLKEYLEERKDSNSALFVTKRKPYDRLHKEGITRLMQKLGRISNISNVHAHKFRRTTATNLLRKGMPLEEVGTILGHSSLNTTMIYYTLNQSDIKHHYDVCM